MAENKNECNFGDDVAGAKMSNGGGTYFLAGRYPRLRITDVKTFKGQETDIPTCVVEFEIVEPFQPKAPNKVEDRPVGTSVSWVQKVRPDIKKTVLANMKLAAMHFLRQIAKNAGKEEWASISEEHVTSARINNDLFCNNSKLIGLEIASEAYEHKTKKVDETTKMQKVIVLNKWINL